MNRNHYYKSSSNASNKEMVIMDARPGKLNSRSNSISDPNTSQSLASILNNPNASDASSWVGWWSSSASVAPPEFAPLVPKSASDSVTRSDFQPYLASVSDHYNRFADILNHVKKEKSDVDSIGGQGEALVACLREVPALYFKEDFALEDGATFRSACPFTNLSENLVLQEKLSHYLDVVELHLVKEISLRSNSFFEAQGQLQDLNVKIVEGCSRIRELKETILLLDVDLVECARQIHDLNETRSNLLALQQKLRLILYVNQALSALKLLVASADCAGALDVTDDLQHLLDGDELTGLHCFHHLRDRVAASIESINSILSAEFMHASIHDAGDTDVIIISRVKARASSIMNGEGEDGEQIKLDDEETSNFQDRLLPVIIGLLRTAKLPSVLRLYRDQLTADMKTAIKNAVAELLPILVSRPLESDFTPGERVDADGFGASLASKLRSLSSESFVQLLSAIFLIVRAHLVRAAEVKKAIEWIMCNLDGHYAADSVAAAIAVGAAAAETAQESDGQGGLLMPYSPHRVATKALSIQGKANDAASPSNISKNFRADVLRENTEAVVAACDAAHGRWAKLLGVRALLHPKLRLQEFLSIYNITQDFITATEKIGGRPGFSIRGTIQSQAKAFMDFQHESRMAKIKAVLDQETWVEVDVPNEFQIIVTSLFSSESLVSENLDAVQDNTETSYNEVATISNSSRAAETGSSVAEQQSKGVESSETSADVTARETPNSDGTEKNKADVANSVAQNNHSNKERGKSTSQSIFYKGVGFHMVNWSVALFFIFLFVYLFVSPIYSLFFFTPILICNLEFCGLILMKMLSEYIDMNNFFPTLSSEVVHRIVEILKFFNTRTCQLVLGAGAMQVSGLKSITSKHLALASQVISFTYAIIPEIRQILFQKVPETRKALLLPEIDRVAQDYKVHRDEIHTKLVQIMRERLLVHLRGLPQIVESWNRSEEADPQPSQFARSLTKEVGYLQRVLTRTLHEVDVQAIFRQVILVFHSQISEAFSRLEISTPQAKDRLRRDVKHILGCIRSLPSDKMSESSIPNWGQLDEFLVQRFGEEAS
ncbi:vacuolar protein sorting-associated protein 54, chloroplastic isoform X1 [Pyrus x bretschneideri]|uniref:vacuolar protein sorting-associated protein 54, chloroplastic isoform X1 n=1 Tax=Pyrus x bretschneideri TaxID=225117 RepID=UPI00202E49DB|nr:vacuolar protein sorting-associated protein 54, chloroplastic isoform X1 [Pyrus x bretschneideri]XP_048424311.1 vacuolar protein sorting-associated protein 54, chloroplastic isoform X1 [Pyrus x bretschneideri]